ncbi:Ig-like domain-containing protein, partial [Elusimicrobiota bacterium]
EGTTVWGVVKAQATASDDIRVTSVEFYVDGVLKATGSNRKATFFWDTREIPNGTHVLSAKVYDDVGLSSEDSVTVIVAQSMAKSASLRASPNPCKIADGESKCSTTIFYEASSLATPNRRSAFRIYVTRNGTTETYIHYSRNPSGQFDYSRIYSTSPSEFRLYSDFGVRVATLSVVGLKGDIAPPPDTTPPTVNIAEPADGASLSGTVAARASAADNTGVSKVEFYVDGNLMGTDAASPYAFTWDTTKSADGQHSLKAKAYDAAGNTAAAAITVDVKNSSSFGDTTPPTVQITEPANGATIKGKTPYQAMVNDDGVVDRVEFYVDDALIYTDSAYPYSFMLNTVDVVEGTRELKVKAYDQAGNLSETLVSVKVDNVQGVVGTFNINPDPCRSAPGTDSCTPTIEWTVTGPWARKIGARVRQTWAKAEPEFTPPIIFGTVKDSNGEGTFINEPPGYMHPGYKYIFRLYAREYMFIEETGRWGYVNVALLDEKAVWGAPPEDAIPPAINIAQPAEGNTVWGVVRAQVTTQSDGRVTDVEFYVDGVLIPRDFRNAHKEIFFWDTREFADGTHVLKAKVYDDRRLSSEDSVTVTVANSMAQSCSLSASPNPCVIADGATKCSTTITYDASGLCWRGGVYLSRDGFNEVYVGSSRHGRIDYSRVYASPSELRLYTKSGVRVATLSVVGLENDVTPPTVSVSWPSNTSAFMDTETILIVGSDVIGVTKVEFYVDGVLKAASAESRLVYQWDTTKFADGEHTLMAKAYDAAGNVKERSYPVLVRNVATTTGTLTPSVNPCILDEGETRCRITLAKTYSGATSGIWYSVDDGPKQQVSCSAGESGTSDARAEYGKKVEYFLTEQLRCYSRPGPTLASVVLRAAYAQEAIPPTVKITQPANGASVSGMVPVRASAADETGVAKVEFYVDGKLMSTDAASPFGFTWNASGAFRGWHMLKARAYDAAGNAGEDAVSVRVLDAAAAGERTSLTVGGVGGILGSPMGSLTIPEGAADEEITVSIEGEENDSFVEVDKRAHEARAKGLQGRSQGVILRPLNARFDGPITVELPLDPSLSAEEAGNEDLLIFAWDRNREQWKPLPSEFDRDRNLMRAHTTSLGVFRVFSLGSPDGSNAPDVGEVFVFPNPARGSEKPTFHMAMDSSAQIEIQVYDITGNRVHEARLSGEPALVDRGGGFHKAYEYTWDATGAGSGLYLYKLRVHDQGSRIHTGKLAIIH